MKVFDIETYLTEDEIKVVKNGTELLQDFVISCQNAVDVAIEQELQVCLVQALLASPQIQQTTRSGEKKQFPFSQQDIDKIRHALSLIDKSVKCLQKDEFLGNYYKNMKSIRQKFDDILRLVK